MTVPSDLNRHEYTGNGALTVYPYAFRVFSAEHFEVYVDDVLQTLTTHYSITGVADPNGGNVVFVTAPGDTLSIVILRVVPLTQETDYTPNAKFPESAHEDALDKLTMITQQLQEALSRSFKLEVSSILDEPVIPVVANAFLQWNSSATALIAASFAAPVGTIDTTVARINFGDGASLVSDSRLEWDNANKVLRLGVGATMGAAATDTVKIGVVDLAGAGTGGLLILDERGSLFEIGDIFGGLSAGFSVFSLEGVDLAFGTETGRGIIGTTTNHSFDIFVNNAQRVRLDPSGNLGLGTESFGASAQKTFAQAIGVAPTTSPADVVQETVVDLAGAGTAGKQWRDETGHVHEMGRLLKLQAGSSVSRGAVGGTLDALKVAATPASTVETDLWTYTIKANTLAVDGDTLDLDFVIRTAGNANNKTTRIKFGATTVFTRGPSADNNVACTYRVRVMRNGAATQMVSIFQLSPGFSNLIYSETAETNSGDIIFKVTGQNGTASASDMTINIVTLAFLSFA